MIDEKKLVKDIWELFSETYTNAFKFSEEETKLAERIMIDVQKLAESQPKIGEWIPCSDDNLSEKEVLCCEKCGEMMFGYVFKAEEGTYNAESEHEFMYDCVAWKPKPEPYREEIGK